MKKFLKTLVLLFLLCVVLLALPPVRRQVEQRLYPRKYNDLVEQYGDSLLEKTPEERFAIIEGYGLPTNIARMERDLKRYKINYDVWFRESTLHESGYVQETIDMLTKSEAKRS